MQRETDVQTETRQPRLRVCHVAYTFYENDNRVIRYVESLAEGGHEVDVIALRGPHSDRQEDSKARVFRIQRRTFTEKNPLTFLVKILWFMAKATVLLTAMHLKKRYDIVHVHNVPDFLVFTALVPKLTGARIILDIHDILPELYGIKFNAGPRSRLFAAMLWVERMSCSFADHVIIANHLWYDKLTGRAVTPERCTTMMNYPDLRLFKPIEQTSRRERLFTLIYPGTLNHHQGLDIAVEAFTAVKDRMPGAEFHIYGEGPTKLELIELIEKLGIGGRVKMLEPLPIAQIAAVMAAADVGVVPKRADGFGNEAFSTKILEFMACDVPVIVSRTRVDEHYFTDDLVRFFRPGDVAELGEAMVWVYENRHRHAAWTRAARDYAVNYSWQARGADYLRITDSLRPCPEPARQNV